MRRRFSNHPFTGGDTPDYWFLGRADDAIVQGGSPLYRISQALDKSGKGIDVSEPILTRQPTYDGLVNGLTVPRFSQPLHGLSKQTATGFGITDYTIMGVASHALGGTTPSDGRLATHRNIFFPSECIFDCSIKGYDDPEQGKIQVFDGSISHRTTTAVITSGVPFLFTYLLEQGKPTGKIRIDGVDVLTGFTFNSTSAAGQFWIGRFSDEELEGIIAEILIWKKVLPDFKVLFYERYLRNVYAP
jgi:hypothetical protein